MTMRSLRDGDLVAAASRSRVRISRFDLGVPRVAYVPILQDGALYVNLFWYVRQVGLLQVHSPKLTWKPI